MPLPVTVVKDPWDWAVVWAAIAGVFLAVIAIVFAAVTFYISNRALVRERRITFELGVLAQLAEFAGYYRAGSGNVVLALVRLLPDEDMPRLRQALESRELETSIPGDVLADYWDEYRQAVDRRRHPPSV
jgi:hypothetical protein